MIYAILIPLLIISFFTGAYRNYNVVKKTIQKINDESKNNAERFYDRVFNEFELKNYKK